MYGALNTSEKLRYSVIYIWLLCTTTRRTTLYELPHTAPTNVAPDYELTISKHVDQLMVDKDNIKICASSLSTYIRIAIDARHIQFQIQILTLNSL
jgi:hypothetical protein